MNGRMKQQLNMMPPQNLNTVLINDNMESTSVRSACNLEQRVGMGLFMMLMMLRVTMKIVVMTLITRETTTAMKIVVVVWARNTLSSAVVIHRSRSQL
jgi:hypothetical protein